MELAQVGWNIWVGNLAISFIRLQPEQSTIF